MRTFLQTTPPRVSFLSLLLVGSGLALGAGCRGSDVGPQDNTSSSDHPHAEDDADLLFQADRVPVFEVTMPPAQWTEMQDQALEEAYYPVELQYDGVELGEVGLRFKGNYGSLILCFDEQGKLVCPKLSMKLKFSEYDDKGRFFGLKRLNLHAMARDASKIREQISYALFREMDVIAPRTAYARLVVNGTSLGLFTLVEQIDGRFTDDRFEPDGDGNLFKEAWPNSTDEASYTDKLTTNEETANFDAITQFSRELSSVSGDGLPDVLADWMNVDALYRYMAVHDAIANWDGITAFYCSEWGCNPHNFYLYQHEIEDQFSLIPWDLDATLSPSTPFDSIPHWTDSRDCAELYPIFSDAEVRPPGCDPILRALASDRGRYEEAIDTLLAGPFRVDTLEDRIEELAALIEEEIALDPTMAGVEAWRAHVDELKANLKHLVARIMALRDQTPITPFALDAESGTDFESASEFAVALGVSALSNQASSTHLSLNTESALAGSKNLRMDFIYRDEPNEPWAQWGIVTLPLETPPVDFSSASGITFTLRTDGDRTVRIDLESDSQAGAISGIKFGWEVVASNSPTQVSVLFADATIPSWATDMGDDKDLIVATTRGLSFSPLVNGRGEGGFLGAGLEDSGYLEIDDIQFF